MDDHTDGGGDAGSSGEVATSRWVEITRENPDHSTWYVERFRTMAADGDDLDGEARLIDAMVPRGARLLDAGCGPGRVGGRLSVLGHDVVGVDVDPVLIAAAEHDHPGPALARRRPGRARPPGAGRTRRVRRDRLCGQRHDLPRAEHPIAGAASDSLRTSVPTVVSWWASAPGVTTTSTTSSPTSAAPASRPRCSCRAGTCAPSTTGPTTSSPWWGCRRPIDGR